MKSSGGGVSPGMGVVGVGVVGDELMRGVTAEYQHGRVNVYTEYNVSCTCLG